MTFFLLDTVTKQLYRKNVNIDKPGVTVARKLQQNNHKEKKALGKQIKKGTHQILANNQ